MTPKKRPVRARKPAAKKTVARKKTAKPKAIAKKRTAAKRAPAKKAAASRKSGAKKKATARARKPQPTAANAVTTPQKGPTSAAPNPLHGKKRPVARAVSKLRLKLVKVRHTLALTPEQVHAAKRAQVVAFCKWAIAHAADIHYPRDEGGLGGPSRPIPVVTPGKLPMLPFTTDCSGLDTMAYQYADLPNPNGDGWLHRGTEYTGTLLEHGVVTHTPKRGDIGIYGTKPSHHAVIALNDGGTQLSSHGSERGPLNISAADEMAYQKSTLTWLDLGALT